jgi:general transcription factor 3C polypeptide 3 (transcription factor C subunit 4)
METALAQARYRSAESAYETLRAARNASVFHLDEVRNSIIVLVFISCALLSGDFQTANDYVRQYLLAHQFENDGYRIYGAAFASGVSATELYHSSQNQKFFLRQVKAIDSVVENRQITGAARVTSSSKVDALNPNLLLLYAHIMLTGKSYVPCAHYLARAAPLMDSDPLVLLTHGVLHIHRALQRQTNNRHLQIVQGLSYLFDYRDMRKKNGSNEDQETLYNLGRAFQMLGLSSFAATYYHKVLEIKDVPGIFDLRRDAAYNLQLIYTLSGNPALARSIIDENIVI